MVAISFLQEFFLFAFDAQRTYTAVVRVEFTVYTLFQFALLESDEIAYVSLMRANDVHGSLRRGGILLRQHFSSCLCPPRFIGGPFRVAHIHLLAPGSEYGLSVAVFGFDV